jgi:tRNA-dihydrouridine synthase B
MISEHYESMLMEYGSTIGIRAARKHLGWYLEAAGLGGDRFLRRLLLENDDPAQVIAALPGVFGDALKEAA